MFKKGLKNPVLKVIAIMLLLVVTLIQMTGCTGTGSTTTNPVESSTTSTITHTSTATTTTEPVLTPSIPLTETTTTEPGLTSTTTSTETSTTEPETNKTEEPTSTPTPTPAPTPTSTATTTTHSSGSGGSGGGSHTAKKRPVENLRIGTTYGYPELFTMVSNNDGGTFLRMNHYSFCAAPFLEYDEDGNIKPYIMTKWKIADDDKSMVATFATNKGITWHDGKPLTIDDIVFTYTVNKNGLKHSTDIDHVEQIDNTTLKMYFTTTAFRFLNTNVGYSYVYPKHVWENVEDPKTYDGADATIGCGPYKFVGCDQDAQTIYYEAVDDYFKGDLTVKKVSVRSFGSADSLILALKNGEIDAMSNYSSGLDASALPAISDVKGLNPGKSINPGNYQLSFGFKCDSDYNSTPTNELEFRKAVSPALDYKLLATAIGGEVPGSGIIPPPNVGYDSSLPKLKQDIDLAKSTLESAGYKDLNQDGFRELPSGDAMNLVVITQVNASKGVIYARIAEIITSNLNAVGIHTTIDERSLTDQKYCLGLTRDGTYQLYVGFTSSAWAHYKTAFGYMVTGLGLTGTCDIPEVVDSYTALMNAGSTSEYIKYIKKLQKLASQHVFGLALCWDNTYFPYRTDKMKGWVNYPGQGVINGETWYEVSMK